VIFEPAEGAPREPDLVITPGHYMERYMTLLEEWPSADLPPPHRLYLSPGLPGEALRIPAAWPAALAELGPLYIERRRGAVLLFAPFRALEPVERIEALARVFDEERRAAAA